MHANRIHCLGAVALVVTVGLTAVSAAASAPAAKIAFVSYRGGGPANHGTVYVVNPDGSGRRILARNVLDATPAWSPDGRTLTFGRWVDDNAELYVMNADGSGQRRLTSDPALDVGAAWSPDGRTIAFVRGPAGDGRVEFDLYVMNADGSSQRSLSRNAGGLPVWSPDGRKIAFLAGSDIDVVNADGSGRRSLTHSPAYEDSLAWSPDGRSIALVKHSGCYRCSPNSELWVMRADGSGKHVVAIGEGIGDPSWSPDGRSLVYGNSYRPNPNDSRLRFMYVGELFRVNADGSGRLRLTYGAQPLWSPDGRLIAFLRRGRLVGGLYLMNADGSGQRRLLAPSSANVVSFAWSPRGTN